MTNTIQLIPYLILAIWFVFSVYYLIRAIRSPDKINPYIFESIPQVFPTIGILGTFIGIAYGLWYFDVNNIEGSIPELLKGLKTAFIASIFGIILSILFSKFTALIQRKNERGKLSNETVALNQLIELVNEIKNSFSDSFIYRDENNNKVTPANIFRVLSEESRKQSGALQAFSTDLANKVEAGFEKIINTPDKGVVAELQSVKNEIENLGKKMQDPTTEMTQNVVTQLQTALKNMIDEFKASMSGSTKSELENLTALLTQAGGSLTDFPAKLQSMTDNLNENFKGLQDVVQQIAKQTLSQSEHSTGQMRKQVEEMSEILKNKVGDLQIGQEVLITKQSENLQVSDKLLNAFNTSIEKMNGLSNGVTETILQLNKAQSELDKVATSLSIMTNNVNISANNFGEAQLKFSQHSNEFLKSNDETIKQIQNSLVRATEVSKKHSENFTVIEKGLQGIFNQIQKGLDDYKNTVGESLESYLGKYTASLTSAAKSMADASASQQGILDELTEQLSKLNGRNN